MTSKTFSGSFTSESVTSGHPDKMADKISDSILDDLLRQDPEGRAAIETLVAKGVVVVAGEIRTEVAYVDISSIVRETVLGIGYNAGSLGFDGNTCGVMVAIGEQSDEIAEAVDESEDAEQGAGDQGMMFGYACNETDEKMPMPISVAHRLARQLEEARRSGTVPYLRPDGKTQVTFKYKNGVPVRLEKVLISAHHSDACDLEEMLAPDLREHVILPALPQQFRDDDFEFIANPSGSFETGGPVADAGLTGRKIIVDTYGGYSRHGGGAFSGKDPSKVDRSAAYAARWVAKHLVAAGASDRCELQLAYAIGAPEPVSVMVETFGTSEHSSEELTNAVRQVFDLQPKQIIDALGLKAPIYAPTAAYGHFGREPEGGCFLWEQVDAARVAAIKAALGG